MVGLKGGRGGDTGLRHRAGCFQLLRGRRPVSVEFGGQGSSCCDMPQELARVCTGAIFTQILFGLPLREVDLLCIASAATSGVASTRFSQLHKGRNLQSSVEESAAHNCLSAGCDPEKALGAGPGGCKRAHKHSGSLEEEGLLANGTRGAADCQLAA